MSHWQILIVEDDVTYQKSLARYLQKKFSVYVASSIKQARKLFQTREIDLALIDINLPDGNGLTLIDEIHQSKPELLMIAMTAYNQPDTVVQAIQRGVFHYLAKPFPLEELSHLVETAFRNLRLERENARYQKVLAEQYQFENIIGKSIAMLNMFEMIEKISKTDSTVLIRGESGTGKELVAKAIHVNSHRANQPLVAVNCGALTEELLESELFGHTKGAFTGAHASRKGRFETANEGTIFLDEVGDMSPRLQVKVLRVLQEQKFEPVGSSESVSVNVRIIAATHQDLETAVKNKTFREDLYYRLNVIPIYIPALRERMGDVPLLLNHFVEKINYDKKKNITGFTDEVFDALCKYDWPGNVRELENLIERLVVLRGQGKIISKDLPEKYFSGTHRQRFYLAHLPSEGVDLNAMVDDFESGLIHQALQRTQGNKNQAARLLKIKRTTLVEKLKRKKLS